MAAIPGVGDRMAEEAPEPHVGHLLEPMAHPAVEACEGEAQIHRIVAQVPALLHPAFPLFDGHDIAHGAAAHGVAHEMAALAHMHLGHHRLARCGGDHRAPRHLIGEEGLRRPVQLGPHQRMQPVRADEQVRRIFRTLRRNQSRARPAQIHRLDLLEQPDLHARLARALGQKVDQVGAVHEMVALPGPEPREIELQHQIAADAVAQLHRLRAHRGRLERVAEAQGAQHGRTVRRDLQARAHFADRLGLLEHCDLGPAERERPSHRQTGNAGPEDGDLGILQAHRVPPHANAGPNGSGVSFCARAAGGQAGRRRCAYSSRCTRSRRSWRSCASSVMVAIGRASRRLSEMGSPVTSQ